MQWLNSTGIAISLFFSFFILVKKNRKMTDYLLILINLLTISFFVLDIVARVQLTPLIFFFQSVAPLLLFPVYLIFALEAVQHKIVKTNQWIWFFVPSLVSTIFFTSSDIYRSVLLDDGHRIRKPGRLFCCINSIPRLLP